MKELEDRNTLKYWEKAARKEIWKFLVDATYAQEIMKHVMPNEDMGPFTKLLYSFAIDCKCGWGVMIDFNERKQRIYLVDEYYKWMHVLKEDLETGVALVNKNEKEQNEKH